jgi:hypothetical protein
MLPSYFRRCSVASRRDELSDAIYCGMTGALRLSRRLDDKFWWVEVDRHLDDQHRGHRNCTSYEQEVIGSELWAVRHQRRLRLKIDPRELCRAA